MTAYVTAQTNSAWRPSRGNELMIKIRWKHRGVKGKGKAVAELDVGSIFLRFLLLFYMIIMRV